MTNSTGPTTITDNFIDWTPNADAPAQPNNDIRLTNELGNLNNVTVSGNYLIGGDSRSMSEVAAPHTRPPT